MRLSLFLKRILWFWEKNAETRDEETKPLIQKSTNKENDTCGSSENHEDQTKVFFWSAFLPDQQPLNLSDLTDYLLKYVLFTSNFLLCVLGLATLAVGFWGLLNKQSFAQEKLDGIGTDPMLLLVFLGFLLFILCLTGCVGVLRENRCLLRTFSAILLVCIVTQVLLAIVAYSLQERLSELLSSAMTAAMIRYQDDLDLRFIVDEIQIGLQCCGVDTYRDWEVNQYFNCSSPGVQACGVPPSCCVDPFENGTIWNSQCGLYTQQLDEFSAQSRIYLGGCGGGISRWIARHAELISVVTVGLLGVQILILTFTLRFLDRIQWNKSRAW